MLKIGISDGREDAAKYAQLLINLNSGDVCSEGHLFFSKVFGSVLVLTVFFLQGLNSAIICLFACSLNECVFVGVCLEL